jgi:hypothetical protein
MEFEPVENLPWGVLNEELVGRLQERKGVCGVFLCVDGLEHVLEDP